MPIRTLPDKLGNHMIKIDYWFAQTPFLTN
jgi:hypothetical protein